MVIIMKLSGNWKLGYCGHQDFKEAGKSPCSFKDLDRKYIKCADGHVPGNFEADLEMAGKINPVFYGRNLNEERERELWHLFYGRQFDFSPKSGAKYRLLFEGIDTIADIYLNGSHIAHTDNMLMSHEIPLKADMLKDGENEIFVHILPVVTQARAHDYNMLERGLKYGEDSLYIRKSAYMFGWDIFPRMLSGGIWKDVYLEEKPRFEFKQSYLFVKDLEKDFKKADLCYYCELELDDISYEGLELELTGSCGESEFYIKKDVWNKNNHINFILDNPSLWWPRRMGEQKLYHVTARLLKDGQELAAKDFPFGVRTVKLLKTGTTDEKGNGEFCFIVNGRKMFVLGTNWVPLDSLPSRGREKIAGAIALVEDTNCNMIRCWGGGYYEDDLFYELCDEKGILIWQDFMQACAIYPYDESFLREFKKEVVFQIRRLRQHASLALWSGDNENDMLYEEFTGHVVDPNLNLNTRKVIPYAILENDYVREYLPSSPYIDKTAWENMADTPEQHLWGPRDYYKGSFYRDATAHFASETGYHGCPSPDSIKKFISPEALWPYNDNGEWLLHASSPTEKPDEEFAYRIPLMANQIKVLFGEIPDNLEEFSLLSQISQAEAKKYFIERFRIGKWRRTGIIWWNMLDGCPQFSDAVVDYYFEKKLAYYYIKRSQEMVAFMCDEPCEGKIKLIGVNDYADDVQAAYRVLDVTCDKVMAEGSCLIKADSAETVAVMDAGKRDGFYLIEWESGGKRCRNHYMAWENPVDKGRYLEMAKKARIL